MHEVNGSFTISLFSESIKSDSSNEKVLIKGVSFWVVKHVRLHWNSSRWSYCFMCESFKNTELPEKKCQHSTEIPEGEAFSNTICPEGKNPTLF